jgi:shikimate dehydrogenase
MQHQPTQQIGGNTQLLGVLGWPVQHSLSPRLHNYWLQQAGLDAVYLPLAVPPTGLAAALAGLAQLGFRGANVTIPHKEQLLPFLAARTPVARQIGAVNTLVVQPDGGLLGTNTDAFGFMRNIAAAGHSVQQGAALLLGAGGAARAVLVGLAEGGCKQIYLANRAPERAAALALEFAALGATITPVPWAEWPRLLPEVTLLVNSTACGLNGTDDFTESLMALPLGAAVCDLVYRPLQTGLLRQAAIAGRLPIDGLGMLLYQAQASFQHWFGQTPPVDAAVRRHVLPDAPEVA